MLDKYKISEDEMISIEEKNKKLARRKLYLDFVNSQRTGFYRFLEYLNETLNSLQERGEVSSFVELRARIKAVNSALNNDESKILDDAFGVEFICVNTLEIEKIKDIIERKMRSTRNKDHDKSNGYKAIHRSYSVLSDDSKWNLAKDDVPAVECQFKTIAVDTDENASHHDYKKVDKDKMHKVLSEKVLTIGEEIPEMWISQNGIIRKLTYKEIIRKVYPFIDITNIKEPEIEKLENKMR